MGYKGSKDNPHYPRKIRADAAWMHRNMPRGRCLICKHVIGSHRLLCRECVNELKDVQNVNVKG